jgi:hypothetical protein
MMCCAYPPEIGKPLAYKANRAGVVERFADHAVQKSVEADLALIDHYDQLLNDVELTIVQTAKQATQGISLSHACSRSCWTASLNAKVRIGFLSQSPGL